MKTYWIEWIFREIVVPGVTKCVRATCPHVPEDDQDELIAEGKMAVWGDEKVRVLAALLANGDQTVTEDLRLRVWEITREVIARYFEDRGEKVDFGPLNPDGENGGTPAKVIVRTAAEASDPLETFLATFPVEQRDDVLARLETLFPGLEGLQRVVFRTRRQGLSYARIAQILSTEVEAVSERSLQFNYRTAIENFVRWYHETYPSDSRSDDEEETSW